MLSSIGDDASRQRYRTEQLIEEAINSSVLEGAKLTTRAQAKAMIRDGRPPASRGERMVVNNYNAMLRLLAIADKKLTVDDLLEIHAILGEDALEAQDAAGRLRTEKDDVRVEDSTTGETWFVPTHASLLRERLNLMLQFANDEGTTAFLHPLVRAIVLHFWLAYLHPFADGNGRMARALFYWQMLRAGYDFAQYLSISGPIDRSPRAYYRAFVYVETDAGDLTYFLLNQLQVLRRATDELTDHLRERSDRLRQLSVAISNEKLNHRQRTVLSDLIRNSEAGVTTKRHADIYRISYLTARKDLQELEDEGYLRRMRVGKTDHYFPSNDLVKRFDKTR
jgi:Fic family protein